MTPDMLNAGLEAVGALLIWNNVRVLAQDRRVRGVSPWAQTFYAFWGLCNIWLHVMLDLPMTLVCGAILTAGSCTWSGLAWWYIHLERSGRSTTHANVYRLAPRGTWCGRR